MKTGQVFISHTSDMALFPEDRPFVQATLDAVGRAGMAPVDMRHFAARDGTPRRLLPRKRVRDCEIYVAVVGFRYGSLVSGRGRLAYTELEFQRGQRWPACPGSCSCWRMAACPPGPGRRRQRPGGPVPPAVA